MTDLASQAIVFFLRLLVCLTELLHFSLQSSYSCMFHSWEFRQSCCGRVVFPRFAELQFSVLESIVHGLEMLRV